MTDVDVTWIEEDAHEYSASQSELGPDAARLTWRAACEAAEDWDPGVSDDDLVDHFGAYGAWAEEELREMGSQGLRALLIQDAAAAIRRWETGDDESRIYQATADGTLFYTLGE